MTTSQTGIVAVLLLLCSCLSAAHCVLQYAAQYDLHTANVQTCTIALLFNSHSAIEAVLTPWHLTQLTAPWHTLQCGH